MIQDDQSQYTINKTLQRLLQDSDKGSVNITGLPAGEYNLSVYDENTMMVNNRSAYQHLSLLLFSPLLPSPMPASSAVVITGTNSLLICVSVHDLQFFRHT